jgi:HPr kinase/phosphorylase
MQNNVTTHGVLVSIHNQGILITGAPGVGKSYAALMLLDRGHQLIADDVIQLENQHNHLIGHCPPNLAGLLKVRGLNLVNVENIFGGQALQVTHRIDYVIHLAKIDDEQLNSLNGTTDEIMLCDISIPRITLMPSYSNMAFMIELAIKNYQPTCDKVEQHICA